MEKTEALNTVSRFSELMPHDQRVVEQIAADMRLHGYDTAMPIVIWRGHNNIVLDGHLRLAAAKEAGLAMVAVYENSFETVDEAIRYAIRMNICRNSFSIGEIDKALEKAYSACIDRYRKRLIRHVEITTVEVIL